MNPELKRTNFADMFGTTALPVLEEIFEGTVKQHPSIRNEIFKVIPHDRDIWQYTEVHDMPLASSVSEGADYTFNRPKQGSDKTLTVVKYGLGFSVSEETLEDQKFDFLRDGMAKLARSARESQEQAAMDIFNNGFSSVTTADGVALFSTSHTTPTGTYTIANRPASDVDLSFSSFNNAVSAFKKAFRGDSGIYQMVMPKILLVPTELEFYARQLLQSAQKIDTNDNNMNPFQGMLQIIASPHLTDADAWFLIGDKADHGLRLVTRKPLELVMAGKDVGYVNDSVLVKARYREAIGAVKPHAVYGTSGA